MVQCSVDALQLQFIHLLTRPQTPLTSSQRPKGDDTVEMEPFKSITKKSMLSFNCYDLIIKVAIQVLVVLWYIAICIYKIICALNNVFDILLIFRFVVHKTFLER